MTSCIGLNTLIHILLIFQNLCESLLIRPNTFYKLANISLDNNKSINSPTRNINRLNLALGGDILTLSNGKSVLILNDNIMSDLVRSHLNIAGINSHLYRPSDDLFTSLPQLFDLSARIPADSAVVIGCNLGILDYIWWKIKCAYNNLVLITGDCYNSDCSVSTNSTFDLYSRILIKFKSHFLNTNTSNNDNSTLASELAASVVASETIKSVTGVFDLLKIPLNQRINTPKNMPMNILLIGAGAVGCEMVRMLHKMGFLGPGSKLTIVDFDIVDSVNLTTQLVYSVQDVGLDKAKAIYNYLMRASGKSDHKDARLEIYPISAVFDGTNAKRIFKNWITTSAGDKRPKLIIAAVDNFKARLLIDRYSLLYQIPLLEVGIDGTKGSTSISIPFKTDPYSSMPGNPISVASCSVKGIPNSTLDTALFGKLLVTKLLFNNNFNQSKSQLKSKIMGFFPKNSQDWFISEIDAIVSLALEVQDNFIQEYGKVSDSIRYLESNDKSRLLMVKLANLRARAFGLEPSTEEIILAMIDDIVPSASFATSSIVALALSNLIDLKSDNLLLKTYEYRNNNYKLVCKNGVMTLYLDDNPMIWLNMHRYNSLFKKNNYFWYFINMATCNFTKVKAPEIDVWWPDQKSLIGKTRVGLSVWDVFNPCNHDITLNELAQCYTALFDANIIGFIALKNDMQDQIIQIDNTSLKELDGCLGLRPIARKDEQSIQLPDLILD